MFNLRMTKVLETELVPLVYKKFLQVNKKRFKISKDVNNPLTKKEIEHTLKCGAGRVWLCSRVLA